MKKIYTVLGALVISGFAMGQTSQGPVKSINHNVHAKGVQGMKPTNINVPAKGGSCLFSNDLSSTTGWNIYNDAGNTDDWVIGTGVPSGAFAIAGITSTTAANGFALFDSDLLCSGSQDAVLEWNADIDLSGNPNTKLVFEQYYRKFQGFTYVEVSGDGGTTWTQYEVNTTYAVNDASATNPEVVSVNISSAAMGSANTRIRFRYVGGCDYAWMIDDICIEVAPDDEMTLSGIGYPTAVQDPYSGGNITYHTYPMNHIMDVEFRGYICNVGAMSQDNVALDVAIPSDGFTASSAAGLTQTAGQCDTVVATAAWTPPSAVGSHAVTFAATYDNVANEASPADNTGATDLHVSQGIFKRHPNNWDGSGLWNGDDGNGNSTAFEMGQMFQMVNADDIAGIGVTFSSNTVTGVLAYAVLYEVDLSTGDFVYVDQSADLTVSAADLAANGPNPVEKIFPLSSPVSVAAGSQYLVCVGHYGGPDEIIVANGNGPTGEQQTFLLDGSDNTWYFLTSNPMVSIHFSNSSAGVGIEEADASNITLGQNRPNPANGTTTINYELEEAGNVTFEVFDVTGKKVMDLNEGSRAAGAHNIVLDVNSLAAGAYHYTLTVNGQRVSKQMVITK